MSARIGVYVCECGPNIPDRIDIDRVLEEISPLKDVAVAKRYRLLCSNDGKKYLADEIRSEKLTHLVVAACSPRDHEKTFMKVCLEAGLNPFLFQMVNIREQCAWIFSEKSEATRMAVKYIRAGISRVTLHEPLLQKEIKATPDVLVVGGGIAGVETALSLAGQKRRVYLVERSDALGGTAARLGRLLPHQGTDMRLIQEKIEHAENNENISVFKGCEVEDIRGFLGNFEVSLKRSGGEPPPEMFRVGAVVVATGFALWDAFDPDVTGYGKIDDVVTSLEFEAMSASGKILKKNGSPPRSVALIHCVGRKEKGYCSKVCCLYSLKFAHQLKDSQPAPDVFEFYSDLCLPEKTDQDVFEEAKKRGVRFLRADDIRVEGRNGKIRIAYRDGSAEEAVEVEMAVLAPAMVPAPDSDRLARMLNIPLDETGFFKEAHSMLDPVSAPISGIYIAGCASGPKSIPESVVQAQAASGKILSVLMLGKTLEPEVKVSTIKEELCTGCQTCLNVCFYGAISFDAFRGVSVVNEAICRGCGSCVGSCPSGAISSKQFTYQQLFKEVMEALR
ncbi:MAG: CoB--CoM heterodisulfide reductase iron-sulfur subunit A family protein [Candidatus Aminicenantes bacterium]|nr:CoB--CoM heterodisulfide reductase iron-sulfur subunit A family protein [Candidatus Aminicenantes bacterium]